MVDKVKGRLFRRKDGKYLIYLPKSLVEDTGFPFPISSSIPLKISFKLGEKKLTIEEWNSSNPAF